MPRNEHMTTRSIQVRGAQTFDQATNSVKAVVATELPARVWDWNRYEYINEILLISGVQLPASGQVPMLDTHDRYSVDKVLGSGREFAPEDTPDGTGLVGGLYFGQTERGQEAAGLVKDGHVTDVSAGYEVMASVWIEDGETATVEGKSYTGPLRVVTAWRLLEISLAPIGADPASKVRARKHKPEGTEMPKDSKVNQGGGAEGASAVPPAAPETRAAAAPQDPPAPAARALSPDDCAEIITRATNAGCPDMAADLIRRGMTPDQASTEILLRMRQDNPPLSGVRVEAGEVERDKFTRAATDGLCMRMGCRVENPAPGAREFQGRSLLRLAAEALARAGVDVNALNDREIAELALGIRSSTTRAFGMVSSDLPHILSGSANRRLLEGWGNQRSTWEQWCATGDVANFKPVEGIRMSDADMLELTNEAGEYTAATFDDAKESYVVRKYGKVFRFTYEMMRNDDLRGFSQILFKIGQASRRSINENVYARLLANPVMADGTAMFHADHLNLEGVVGNIGPVSRDGLSAARAGLRLQKTPKGQEMNLEARYILVPAGQEDALEVLLRSPATIQIQDGNGQVVMNPYTGQPLVPIVEPILDRGGSKAWYVATDPYAEPTVEVGFLDGMQEPDVVEFVENNVDGLSYRARIIFGVGVMGWRGMRKNPGA